MAKIPFEILSLGILVILTALGLAMWAGGLISLAEVPSLVIALFGIWIMALAGIQGNKPAGHGRGAFSTFSWGVLISAVGTVAYHTSFIATHALPLSAGAITTKIKNRIFGQLTTTAGVHVSWQRAANWPSNP